MANDENYAMAGKVAASIAEEASKLKDPPRVQDPPPGLIDSYVDEVDFLVKSVMGAPTYEMYFDTLRGDAFRKHIAIVLSNSYMEGVRAEETRRAVMAHDQANASMRGVLGALFKPK